MAITDEKSVRKDVAGGSSVSAAGARSFSARFRRLRDRARDGGKQGVGGTSAHGPVGVRAWFAGRSVGTRRLIVAAVAVVCVLTVMWDFTGGGVLRQLIERFLLIPRLHESVAGSGWYYRTFEVRWVWLGATVVLAGLVVGLAWHASLRRARVRCTAEARAAADAELAAALGWYLATPAGLSEDAGPDAPGASVTPRGGAAAGSAVAQGGGARASGASGSFAAETGPTAATTPSGAVPAFPADFPELAAEARARRLAFARREQDAAQAGRAEAIDEATRHLRDYMAASDDVDAQALFGSEFTELAAEAVLLKSAADRRERALREEAQRKNDLITYLAHDLKTPLTSVLGYLSLLDEAPDLPGEQRARYTGIALVKAQRLERLINEFFDITRYNLQDVVLEKERVDLGLLFEQLGEEFHPILTAHGNALQVEVPPGASVMADAEKLARVFNNILRNAVFYSTEGTPICVLVERTAEVGVVGAGLPDEGQTRAGTWRFSFTDTGRTIPAHKLTSLFEKFFRLDDARSSNTGGAGLGLAIAKQIVVAHGGTIEAASAEGQTTFTVALPA